MQGLLCPCLRSALPGHSKKHVCPTDLWFSLWSHHSRHHRHPTCGPACAPADSPSGRAASYAEASAAPRSYFARPSAVHLTEGVTYPASVSHSCPYPSAWHSGWCAAGVPRGAEQMFVETALNKSPGGEWP